MAIVTWLWFELLPCALEASPKCSAMEAVCGHEQKDVLSGWIRYSETV